VPSLRRVLFTLSLLLLVVWFFPPLTGWTRRYEFVQAIEWSVFGFWVPVLFVSGAPWRVDAPSARWWRSRRRVSQRRALGAAAAFIAVSLFWRLTPVVNALTQHPALAVVEALSLGAAGIVLFMDLVESPPFRPGISRPYRIGVSAAVMWSSWVFAYLEAMSHTSWYRAFRHVAGRSLSVSADQQLSAGSVWFITGTVFVPIIFWNLVYWLQSEEDPDAELYQLVRQERDRGFFGYRPD